MRKQSPSNLATDLALFKSVRSILRVSLKFYLVLILAGALMLSSLPLSVKAEERSAADDAVTAKTENDGDLSTTKFDTLEGTVVVNLPGDTTAGDEISGTVVEEPKGKTPEEKAANQDTLEGYVVEVANKPTKENDSGQWSIPAKADSIRVVLKKKTGEVVSQTQVPVQESAISGVVIAATSDNNKPKPKQDPAAPGSAGILPQHHDIIDGRTYQVPPVGQVGKPVRIGGQFNGNFTTTAVKIGGQDAPPIAESPRSSIVKIPTGATGPTTIDVVKDGKPVASCPFTVLGIKLAAGNLHLKRGETSQMTVTVSGVRKLAGPAPVKINNKFPQTMRLEGGDSQTLTVPANLDTDTFSAIRTLTGVQIGAFAITAVVKPPPCAAGGCAACNPDAKAETMFNPKEYTVTKTGPTTAPPTPQQATVVPSRSNIYNNRTTAPAPDTKPGERRQPLPNTWTAKNGRIQGLTIQITGADGSIVATQVTDKDGSVDFGVLPEGEYVLTLIASHAPDASLATHRDIRSSTGWRAGQYDWIKASWDGKTEKIEMKPDSSGRYGGAQFAASGMQTFKADGKSRVKGNFFECYPDGRCAQ